MVDLILIPEDKMVTVLLYLNPAWEDQGGRLRLLRQPDDINNFQTEVLPDEGTLLAFKCTGERMARP